MPITGQDRLAKPRAVHDAVPDEVKEATAIKPRAGETFKGFLERLSDGVTDPLYVLLMETGYGEPTQREYLHRLAVVADELYKVRKNLFEAWKP